MEPAILRKTGAGSRRVDRQLYHTYGRADYREFSEDIGESIQPPRSPQKSVGECHRSVRANGAVARVSR